MTIGPCERETADKTGGGVDRAGFEHAAAKLFHREGEVLRRPGPARGINAGCAAQRLDAEAAVVGERRKLRRLRGGEGLEFRILAESLAGLVGLGKTEIGGGNDFDVQRREKVGNLADLAGIVARNDELAAFEMPRHADTASF